MLKRILVITITLSRNNKIYPKTEKINPCRPELKNVLSDKRPGEVHEARGLFITTTFLDPSYLGFFWTYLGFETNTALKVPA